MKKIAFAALVLSVALSVAFTGKRGGKTSVYAGSMDSLSDDCSDHLQNYGHRYDSIVRDEETRSLPNQPLNFVAERNGGIQISTWDKPDFSVKLCKEVVGHSDAEGRKLLADIKLSIDGATVSVSSPQHDDEYGDYNVNATLLIRAPKDAQVTMKVLNGGISVRRFNGTAEAKAVNGGISLKESGGKLTARAQNGGISIQGCSGDVVANVDNGGLSINLSDHWDGKGLEAHTQNGGLVIGIPRNFNSGLEVSASNYVSIICKDDACANGQRTWDDDRRIFRIGSGSPQVRASTVNGGIVIKSTEHSRAMM